MAEPTAPIQPTAIPTYVPGSAADAAGNPAPELAPDLGTPKPVQVEGASPPAPPLKREGGQSSLANPNADSQMIALAQARSAARNFGVFSRALEQMNPADRATTLINWNLDEPGYAALRAKYGLINAAAVEGKGGGETTAVPASQDPLTQAVFGGAAGMEGGIRQGLMALASQPAMQKAIAETQAAIREHLPGHPGVENIVGTLLPFAALLAGGAGLSALAKPGGADAPEAAGATEEAGADTEGQVEPENAPAGAGEGAAAESQPGTGAETADEPGIKPIGAAAAGEEPQGAAAAPSSGSGAADEVAKQEDKESGGGVAQTERAPGLKTPEVEGSKPSAGPGSTAAQWVAGRQATVELAPGIHSNAAMLDEARARPMMPDEMTALAGRLDAEEPEHALPAGGHEMAVEQLRVADYAANQVARYRTHAALAMETGDPGAMAQATEAFNDLVKTSGPAWDAYRHQAGLLLQKVGADPKYQELGEVLAAMRDPQFNMNGTAGQGTTWGLDDYAIAKGVSALPDAATRAQFLADAAKAPWSVSGMVYKLYINGLLSANSILKKTASDAASMIFQPVSRVTAQGIARAGEALSGADYGSTGPAPGEAGMMMVAQAESLGKMAGLAAKSFVQNKPLINPNIGFLDNPTAGSLMEGSGYEDTWWGRGIDATGDILTLPGRSIMTVDQFAKGMQFNMELRAVTWRQAWRDAAGEGLEGNELWNRADELSNQYLANPKPWMLDAAGKSAKVATFQGDLEGSFGALDKIRNDSAIARTLVPFFKTPVNISLQGFRNGPLGLASPTNWRTWRAGGPDAYIQGSKTALGSALSGYLALKILQGKITGGMPPNLTPALRDEYLQDHQLYSVAYGTDEQGRTKWASYEWLEPIAWQLGLLADTIPMGAHLDGASFEEACGRLPGAFAREIDRQPMWGAIHQVARLMDAEEKGRDAVVGVDENGKPIVLNPVTQFLGRQAGGLIPSTISDIAGEQDPVKRQTFTAWQEMRNRIPWLKENGLPSLDPIKGQPMIVPTGFAWNQFPSFKVHSMGADPVADKLVELNNRLGPDIQRMLEIPTSIAGSIQQDDSGNEAVSGAGLTPAERNRWIELRANPGNGIPPLWSQLKTIISKPGFNDQTPQFQANAINEQLAAYRKVAEARLLQENSDLRARMYQAYQAKAAARMPRSAAPPAGTGGVSRIVAP